MENNQNQQQNQEIEKNNQNNFLMAILGQSLPTLWEKFTGQKIAMNGVEMSQNLGAIQAQLQALTNQQNKIWQKLINLENNAQQKFFGLTNKLDKLSGLKLTHERERKQIELGTNTNHLASQEY